MTRYRNIVALLILTAILFAVLFNYTAQQFDRSPTMREYIDQVVTS